MRVAHSVAVNCSCASACCRPQRGRRAARWHAASQSQRTLQRFCEGSGSQSHCCRLHTALGATENSQGAEAASVSDLMEDLQEAIGSEDYTRAAELRDLLKSRQQHDPALLRKRLDELVAEERFEEAAQTRDRLRQLVHQNLEDAKQRTTSDTTTEGVRIQVKSCFVPTQSDPKSSRHYFMYHATITNNGDKTVQLRNRHWIITNAHGQQQEVRGPGVVGETPTLQPGQSFDYTSACPLTTPTGSMEGEYGMIWTENEKEFSAVIGKFALDVQVIAMM